MIGLQEGLLPRAIFLAPIRAAVVAMLPVPRTKVGRAKVVTAAPVPKMIVGAGAAIAIVMQMRAIQAT